MNKTKNCIVKVKASALKVGDMVEVPVGEDFETRGFVKITEIWDVGEARWNGMMDIELNELDDLGEKRLEGFKPNEIMKVRKPLSSMTEAEHKKAIKKLDAEYERIEEAREAHAKALSALKIAQSHTKSHAVKKAYKVKVEA